MGLSAVFLFDSVGKHDSTHAKKKKKESGGITNNSKRKEKSSDQSQLFHKISQYGFY